MKTEMVSYCFIFVFRETNSLIYEKEVINMSTKPVYDALDCMRLIKKKYPLIPICIIRRVLFAEELYMHKVGIIDWIPKLGHWHFKK